jgi:hypothetical protein
MVLPPTSNGIRAPQPQLGDRICYEALALRSRRCAPLFVHAGEFAQLAGASREIHVLLDPVCGVARARHRNVVRRQRHPRIGRRLRQRLRGRGGVKVRTCISTGLPHDRPARSLPGPFGLRGHAGRSCARHGTNRRRHRAR